MIPLFALPVADELRSIGCEFRVLPAKPHLNVEEMIVAFRGCESYIIHDEEGMKRLLAKLKEIPAR